MANHRRSNLSLRRTSFAACLVAVLLGSMAVSPCRAQTAKPRPPGRDAISSKGPLTPEQLAATKAFADAYCAQLSAKTSTFEQVQEARVELTKVLAQINDPQPPFRAEYSSMLVKCLEPAISGGSLHTAANAAEVAAQLGTRGSLNLLLNSSMNQQLPWQTRQVCARGCVTAIKASGLQPKEILDAVRRMRDSLKDESNALIVQYRFEAMLAAADNASLQPPDREKIRSNDLPDAVQAAVEKINQNPEAPSPMFGSLQTVVFRVWRMLIDNKLSPQEIQDIGVKMGPDLVTALNLAKQQWEAAHADAGLTREYSLFIKNSEDLLKRLDLEVRRDVPQRPQTQLQDAWNEKKKDQFDADTKKWQDVVSQPPYAKK